MPMSPRMVIKSHHPWRFRVWILLLLVLVVASAWWLVEYGRNQATNDGGALAREAIGLRAQVERNEQEKEALTARLAVLERAAQVDKQAYGEVERTLKQTQNEMLELKEEVAFYRGIFAPAETSRGLNIADFRVTGIGEERAYRFKLVLTQVQANERIVKGYARVTFEGVQGDARIRLGLNDVTGGSLDRLQLSFKYFQNNEGEFVLPEGFLPSRILVEVVPSVKGFRQLKKTFDWSDIIN